MTYPTYLEAHLTNDRYKALSRSITDRYGLECPLDFSMPKEIYLKQDHLWPARYVLEYKIV